MLNDADVGIQEQAFHVVRHLAEPEEGIEMVFQEMGEQVLLGSLSIALESEHEDVVRQVGLYIKQWVGCVLILSVQAVYVLGNLSNSPAHQQSILVHPRILPSLRHCLIDAKVEVRRPAASCILELVRSNPQHRELHEAGIDTTLRHICDHSGLLGSSPTVRMAALGYQMGVEDDREVKEKCREALQWLEHSAGEVI